MDPFDQIIETDFASDEAMLSRHNELRNIGAIPDSVPILDSLALFNKARSKASASGGDPHRLLRFILRQGSFHEARPVDLAWARKVSGIEQNPAQSLSGAVYRGRKLDDLPLELAQRLASSRQGSPEWFAAQNEAADLRARGSVKELFPKPKTAAGQRVADHWREMIAAGKLAELIEKPGS